MTATVAVAMSPTCVRDVPRTSVRIGPCAVVNVVIVMIVVVIVMHSRCALARSHPREGSLYFHFVPKSNLSL